MDRPQWLRRGRWLIGLLALVVGCSDTPPTETQAPTPNRLPAASFKPESAGTICGRITWEGDVPFVPALTGWTNSLTENGPRERLMMPNPNAPRIDPATRGVGNAVVFLRGIDPALARSWDLPPVLVVQEGHQFHVLQGSLDSPYGFVRQGDSVAMLSRQSVFHALHADGAAFFTLMFPEPARPLERAFNRAGLVELTSAADYFWMRGYLFVDTHPYYARTDSQGRFILAGVPPGMYGLVCWMPNWQQARHEREPETAMICRLFFQPPVEKIKKVSVSPRANQDIIILLSSKDFVPSGGRAH